MNVIDQIKNLDFPIGQYVVVGSGIMAMYGLKQARDVDIVVSPNLFEKCEREGWEQIPYTYTDKLEKHYLQKDPVELYLDVNHGKFRPTFDELLNRAETFDRIPFISLEDLLKFKRSYNRPKDHADIKLIEDFLKNN